MASLINNTAHLIIIGGKRYIPRHPVDGVDVDALAKKYPEVTAMVKSGQLLVVTPKEAKAVEEEVEKDEVAELKAYAKEHGIKLGRASSKEKILAIIKKAEAEALEKEV
jgi:hypothetical protein